ncbi:bifunctional AP-4-A phosphorylase/ADP sulfurylase [Chytridiales sp. JEL 0842]|nr:bifunctional AP-4-A phosphorylase/ADP sulfurylase [Chytridiales sp. JEL 0842]
MLGELIQRRFESALAAGSLVFTNSTIHIIEEAGIKFQVRFAPSLAKKPTGGLATPLPTAEKKKKEPFNPFLNPEDDLRVEDFGTHRLLLNKFSIVKGHVLITTKDWESQSDPLNHKDFRAAWRLFEQDTNNRYLGFYNCGPLSGASVPHKHLQFIPLQPTDDPPVDHLFSHQRKKTTPGTPFTLPVLPFVHSAALLPPTVSKGDADSEPAVIETTYKRLLRDAFQKINVDSTPCFTIHNQTDDPNSTPSYNLIFTREWMMVVPRSKEVFTGCSVNSVGFAGMLLAKTEEEVDVLKGNGVLRVLKGVGFDFQNS